VSPGVSRANSTTAQRHIRHANRILGLFPELLGPGGVQESGRHTAASLAQCARRHGSLAQFFSLNDPPGEHFLRFDDTEFSFHGFGRAKTDFVLSTLRAARPFARSGSRIVVAGHPNLAPLAAAIKMLTPNTRTVVMSHGVEVWEPLPRMRRRALVDADRVLAPSRYTIEKLAVAQRIPRQKIRRLPWPLSLDFLRMAADSAALPLPPEFPHGRILLTVGRWAASERYKGLDELIRVVPQLRANVPDLQLVAIGGGDDHPRLQAIATDLGVADRVHFLERLSREQIAACYARADVFALPSTGEGFGLVFLEAMAFAKPLVGAACGGTTDVVEDGVNGILVPPGDFAALVHSLERLLCDDSLRAKLGRRGAEIVRQKYQFNVFDSELERILEDCGLMEQVVS
jgi:phosphatidylinositol alpha-1,6-mannosyltransferase